MALIDLINDGSFAVHPPLHTRDEQCTIGRDGCCIECGVAHGDPCVDRGGRGFHSNAVEGSDRCWWTGPKQAPAKKLCLCGSLATTRASKSGGPGSDVCRRCWSLDFADAGDARGEA